MTRRIKTNSAHLLDSSASTGGKRVDHGIRRDRHLSGSYDGAPQSIDYMSSTSKRRDGIRLYRAKSTMGRIDTSICTYYDVEIDWFHDPRNRHPVPYSEVIQGYDHLTAVERHYGEGLVGELFTQRETEILKNYIRLEFGWDLIISEVPLPISAVGRRADDLLSSLGAGGTSEVMTIFRNPEMGLPFEISGYYDVSLRPHTPGLLESVHFLRNALDQLGHESPKDQVLESIVRRWHARAVSSASEAADQCETGLFPRI